MRALQRRVPGVGLLVLVLVVLGALGGGSTAAASPQSSSPTTVGQQDESDPQDPTTTEDDSQSPGDAADAPDPAEGRSGYTQGLPPLEGRDGVTSDLYEDDRDIGSIFEIRPGWLDPWWDFKRQLNEKHGLKLQLTYQSLRMWSDQRDDDAETFADAGRLQFQGSWTALGRGTKNPSVITFRMEYRDNVQADIAPSQLGGQFGSAGIVGTGFSNFEFQFRELAWRQTAYSGRWQFATGKISAVSWYNGHALSSPMRGFQNTAVMASNTRPFPGRGLGLVNAFRLGETWGVVVGIHDANAVSADNPFDSIDEAEFFYATEFRWALTTRDRRQWDQARLGFWYQDEREEAGVPQAQGANFAVSRLFKDRYMPFLVGGMSDGDASQMEADIAGGIGIGFETKHRAARDVLGIGVGWGKPPASERNEQITTEMFYRFQLLQNIAFTLSTQYIKDPYVTSTQDEVWVFGFRWRMTF